MPITDELDARIAEATAQLQERDRLLARSADLAEQLPEVRGTVAAAKKEQGKEEHDVARLEGGVARPRRWRPTTC